MEVTTTAELPAPEVPQVRLGTVLKIPAVRQLIALLGIAASVAVGVGVFMWSQSPSMTALYSGLDESDSANRNQDKKSPPQNNHNTKGKERRIWK